MEVKKITAIIRTDVLGQVQTALEAIGVPGMSISRVKGYGEYANFYRADWCVTHARIEVFTEAHQVEEIVEAITDGAYTGVPGDGIVAVTPVERLIHIRSCAEKGKGP
jgi:nitrogen regulatory protein P-II 1